MGQFIINYNDREVEVHICTENNIYLMSPGGEILNEYKSVGSKIKIQIKPLNVVLFEENK